MQPTLVIAQHVLDVKIGLGGEANWDSHVKSAPMFDWKDQPHKCKRLLLHGFSASIYRRRVVLV
jgi:hypothetical protein